MTWSYSYDAHLWPPLITAALTAMLGWYGWQRRNFSGSKPFIIFCLFVFLWSTGSIFEIAATDFFTKIFWVKFQAIWQIPTATALLWFVLEFAGFSRWQTRRNLLLMFSPSLLTLLLIITNDYHHLIWTEFQMRDHVIQIFGIANWILSAYAFILILITAIVLLWLAVRSTHLRLPTIIMLLGMVIGFGFYSLANIDEVMLGPGVRVLLILGPFSLSYALAFFHFRALDPVPLARSAVIEQMGDGMLVLNLDGKIVDSNLTARKIFGVSADSLQGKAIGEVLPVNLKLLEYPVERGSASPEISLGESEMTHYYNLNVTRLNNRRGQVLGYVLLLHNITEQKQAQTQILEQQRVVATLQERERLARELHDTIGQVLGYVSLQAQIIRKLMRAGKNEEAEPEFTNLLEVARDAHADVRESILNLKTGAGQEWSFLPALSQYLTDFRFHHGIQTELLVPDGLTENTFDPGAGVQLLRVIQEALTNARKHSKARSVKVAVELQDYRAHIIIRDDGAGFDLGLKDQENSRHFGLAFMRERMEQIGGSVVIDSHPGAGTVVNLETPLRDQKEKIP